MPNLPSQIRLVAFNRPEYLAQVVAGIKAMRGVADWHIVASVDGLPGGGHNQQVIELCRSITNDVRLRAHLDCNAHVYQNLCEAHDESSDFLYLEDDVVPASDCLDFCRSHAGILLNRPDIKVITLLGAKYLDGYLAWRNIKAFKVHKWFNAWGNYWIKDRLAEVLALWPDEWRKPDNIPWDSRVQMQVFVDQDWLSLTPAVSRVMNIGEVGRYTKSPEEHQKTKYRKFWSDSDYSIQITRHWH